MSGTFAGKNRSSPVLTSAKNTPAHPDYVSSRHGKPVKGNILVMDDDEFILDMMKKMLNIMGYNVTVSANGEDTVSLYRESKETGEPFHCVIMDLSIADGIGGQEVIRLLKEYDSEVRAVITSGYPDDPVVSRFREFGFAGAAIKPFSFEEIRNLLDSIIASD